MDIANISGVGEFTVKTEKNDDKERKIYFAGEKAFLIENKNTIELRCDGKLGKFLREKYESVMESRYFGRGGIEIVTSGQLSADEVDDLIRLSYNLTADSIKE